MKRVRDIQKTLVVSTAHAPTLDELQAFVDDRTTTFEHSGGSAIIVGIGQDAEGREWHKDAPEWVKPILAVAIEEGCNYISFDADGQELDDLPVYERPCPFDAMADERYANTEWESVVTGEWHTHDEQTEWRASVSRSRLTGKFHPAYEISRNGGDFGVCRNDTEFDTAQEAMEKAKKLAVKALNHVEPTHRNEVTGIAVYANEWCVDFADFAEPNERIVRSSNGDLLVCAADGKVVGVMQGDNEDIVRFDVTFLTAACAKVNGRECDILDTRFFTSNGEIVDPETRRVHVAVADQSPSPN